MVAQFDLKLFEEAPKLKRSNRYWRRYFARIYINILREEGGNAAELREALLCAQSALDHWCFGRDGDFKRRLRTQALEWANEQWQAERIAPAVATPDFQHEIDALHTGRYVPGGVQPEKGERFRVRESAQGSLEHHQFRDRCIDKRLLPNPIHRDGEWTYYQLVELGSVASQEKKHG